MRFTLAHNFRYSLLSPNRNRNRCFVLWLWLGVFINISSFFLAASPAVEEEDEEPPGSRRGRGHAETQCDGQTINRYYDDQIYAGFITKIGAGEFEFALRTPLASG